MEMDFINVGKNDYILVGAIRRLYITEENETSILNISLDNGECVGVLGRCEINTFLASLKAITGCAPKFKLPEYTY